jgi:tRNA-dihydrouridine synthase
LAEASVITHHLRLAAGHADEQAYDRAYQEYAGARAIDPALQVFDGPAFRAVKTRHFEALGGAPRFAAMRKHLGWYCKGFFKAAEVRSQMFRTTNSCDVERVLAGII